MSFFTPTLITTPKTPTNSWVRPSDWPATNEADNEIIYLVADIGLTASISYNLTTAYTRPGSENLYIEWGDGTTDTVSGGGATYHTYSVGTGTPCSRGYTTWKIRIYTDAGCTITSAKLYVNPYAGGNIFNQLNTYNIVPILEAKYGSGTRVDSPANLSITTSFKYSYLEYVKYPSTWNGTSLSSAYNGACFSLQRVDLPTSAPNLITMNNAFTNCYNLRGDIVLPSNATITNGQYMFQGCSMISSFTYLGPAGCFSTNGGGMFQGCHNLIRAELGALSSPADLSSLFNTCSNLQSVKIGALYSGVGTANYSSMFTNCYSLEYVILPPITSTGTINMANMFFGCVSLKTMTINASSATINQYNAIFSNCNQLQSAYIFGTNTGSAVNAFNSCYSLTNFSVPSGGATDTNGMFNSCLSLTTINVTGFENTGNMTNMFSNCYSLTNLTLPSGSMTGAPSLQLAFSNCWRISNINMSNFSTITTLSGAFQNNYNLKSITLPTTANSVSSMSNAFSGCNILTSVVLPTSMSACTNWSNAFNNCLSLETIVLPATVPAGTTIFSNTFLNCVSLESITLPTTQTTSLTNCGNMFNQCGSLKEIKNTDKLGSNLTTGALCSFVGNTYTPSLSGLTFSCKMSAFDFSGTSTAISKLTSIRMLNTGTAQWTGSSPQVNISYTSIAYTALVQLFNDIAAQGTVTSKTINITGCAGASSLTSADRLILTSKGWTITG
jgi:hypothetical protein